MPAAAEEKHAVRCGHVSVLRVAQIAIGKLVFRLPVFSGTILCICLSATMDWNVCSSKRMGNIIRSLLWGVVSTVSLIIYI